MQTLVLPFTTGMWQECNSITLTLKEGENTLNLLRREAPQQGVTIEKLVLMPVK